MPLVFGDRVKETSTSVGLGSISLDGAAAGFQTFSSGIGNGNQCFYTIENDADSSWEVGIGTVSGASLSRDSVLSSSNSGLPVNFAAGTKQVFATEAAQHFNNTLDSAAHAAIDHTGLPGVPAAEGFTQPVHDASNHTGVPGVLSTEAFDAVAHQAVTHLGAPWSLLDGPTHDLRDHTGVPGVGGGGETFTKAVHDADDHTGCLPIAPPAQAEAEAGVATTGRLWTAQRVAQAIAAQTGLQVAVALRSAVTGITIATGFQPKLAVFIGRYTGLTAVPTVGYAIGTGGGDQGCVVSGSLEILAGSIAADSGGDSVVDEAHQVSQFDATQVQATQGTGTTTWSGVVIVLGG